MEKTRKTYFCKEFYTAKNLLNSHFSLISSEIYEKLFFISARFLSEKEKTEEKEEEIDEISQKMRKIEEILRFLPKEYISFIFVSEIKRNFANFMIKTCEFHIELWLRSATLKQWRKRCFLLNFSSKKLTIFKEKVEKTVISLEKYAIRWIGRFNEEKWGFSLDSFHKDLKNLVIGGTNEVFLRNFFENIKETINSLDYRPLFEENLKEKGLKRSKSAIITPKRVNSIGKSEENVKISRFLEENEEKTEKIPFLLKNLIKTVNFDEISLLTDYNLLENREEVFIFQSKSDIFQYKLISTIVGFSLSQISEIFSLQKHQKILHKSLISHKILSKISEETTIIEEIHKKFGFFHLKRKFLYIQTFIDETMKNRRFFIRKSIENRENREKPTNFLNFFTKTIESTINSLIISLEKQPDSSIKLILSLNIRNNGFLSAFNEQEITINFLRDFYSFNLILHRNFLCKPESFTSVKDFLSDLKRKSEDNENSFEITIENHEENMLNYEEIPKNLPFPSENPLQRQEKYGLLLDLIRSHEYIYMNLGSIKPRNYSRPSQISLRRNTEEKGHYILKKDWKIDENGEGLVFINKNVLKAQKNMLSYLIKRLGANILQGKSINSIEFPIELFDDKSELEKYASDISFLPFFLEKAAKTEDFNEQIKLVITGFIANLHMNVAQIKPFSSFLGETHQAKIKGNPVFYEQISVKPSISRFLMMGKGFKLSGFNEILANLNPNSCLCRNKGKNMVFFENNHSEIVVFQPIIMINGTAFGKRTFNYEGKMYFFCKKQRKFAEISFNPDKKSLISGFFSKKGRNSDSFYGGIYTIKHDFCEKFCEKFMENTMNFIGISGFSEFIEKKEQEIQGIWHDFVKIDEKIYWKFGEVDAFEVENEEFPLPSDSAFREDIVLWKMGNVKAQMEMERMGLEERRKEDLRKKGRKMRKITRK